jgi:polysaccharide export outer membrane protein
VILSEGFKPGDTIKIEFSAEDLKPIETEIKHDGSLALQLVEEGRITVTGKTPREVETELRELYVPRYYKRLTVTVTPGARFFIVGGEVRSAGRIPYSGKITLVGAVQAAGGFGTFANRKRVEVTRASGELVVVNYNDVLKDSSLDIEIKPGDKIHIPETRW